MGTPARRLRELMSRPTATLAPGVFSPLLARMVAQQGFELVYAGGGAISLHQFGRPDLGLTSLSERVDCIARLTESVGLPLLVDADTGFGSALTIRHCVRELERSGAAGLHIEDEAVKTTHDFGSAIASPESMCQRIEVAVDARRDPDFAIFARCNTLRSHGYEETIERASRYLEAGADGLFVLGMTIDEAIRMPKEFPGIPLIYNMTVRADGPKLPLTELSDAGYKIVIVPNLLSLALAQAAWDILSSLREQGSIAGLLRATLAPERMDEISGFVEADEFQKLHSIA